MGNHQGALVPTIVMGGANGAGTATAASGTQDMVNLLTAKTAQDLALDFGKMGASTPVPATATPAAK